MFVRAGWHRIAAPFMPWMAFGNTLECEQSPAPYAVRFYRLLGISGTAGIKAAVGSQEWTKAGLVTGDKENQKTSHGASCLTRYLGSGWVTWRASFSHCCCNIEDSSALSNRPMPGLASRTTSRCRSATVRWRKNSRDTRLIRLRCTAVFTCFFAMTRPRRCCGRELNLPSSSRCLWEALLSGWSKTLL